LALFLLIIADCFLSARKKEQAIFFPFFFLNFLLKFYNYKANFNLANVIELVQI